MPGQIVLVSTVDAAGEANVAPKSWVSMAAFGGPIVAFGCTEAHRSLANVAETGEFVVNVVSEPLVERVWELVCSHGAERLSRSGLTLVPAQKLRPPLVEECPAHLECELDDVKRYGAGAFVFGRIVAASIDGECLGKDTAEQYFRLRPVFYLEEGTYASIDTAKRVGGVWPADQPVFMIEVGAHGEGAAVSDLRPAPPPTPLPRRT
ncbi:MAG: flavin reductase family protein [Actinomycetota bacterium]|nr:flavin reductase family protein [Actinomycetota bacterium]